jgi:hypothetical protein
MMVRKARISIHHMWFFILNNIIGNDPPIHITNGINVPKAKPIPIRDETIAIVAPPK